MSGFVVNQRWWPLTGSRHDIAYISARTHNSNNIPTATPILPRSVNTDRLPTRDTVLYLGISIFIKNLKFALNVRIPISHLENCKHYLYMILWQQEPECSYLSIRVLTLTIELYYEYSDDWFRLFTVHRDVQLTVKDFMVYSVFPFNYTHQAVPQHFFELVSSLTFAVLIRP